MMKTKLVYIAWIIGFIVLVQAIIKFPRIYFTVLDSKVINIEKQIKIEPINTSINKHETVMNIKDKIEMIEMIDSKTDGVKAVNLETGDVFSLYEARKQCFNELTKIPVLQMDIYGPVKDEIFISPKLYINTNTPSHTMIAWSGTVTIEDLTYHIVLDEKSQKILSIRIVEGNEEKRREKQLILKEEWLDYLEQ